MKKFTDNLTSEEKVTIIGNENDSDFMYDIDDLDGLCDYFLGTDTTIKEVTENYNKTLDSML